MSQVTRKQVADMLEDMGWRRYPSGDHTIKLESGRVDGPDCCCNDRPPAVHIALYPSGPMNDPPAAEFDLFGELPNGRWVKYLTYSYKLPEITPETLKEVEDTLTAAWKASYSAAENHTKREETP